jgi:hypothetical protein
LKAASSTNDERNHFLGTIPMSKYDTERCARECGQVPSCHAFDVFFERAPTLKPGKNCTAPASTTMIKCTLWENTIEKRTATNVGEMDCDFEVVIAGSNGYNRNGWQPREPEPPKKGGAQGLVKPSLVLLGAALVVGLV